MSSSAIQRIRDEVGNLPELDRTPVIIVPENTINTCQTCATFSHRKSKRIDARAYLSHRVKIVA